MTLELTSEQEALVLSLAEQAGKTPAELLLETMSRLERMDDAEEQKLLDARIAEADGDGVEWVSHEEVGRRMGLL